MHAKIKQNPLLVVIFTVFIDLLGFGILIPVIPLLLANPHSPYFLLPKNLNVNQGYILLGFLLASFSIAQFFATPILGQLSDKYGRKPLLAISLFGTCLSYLIFAAGIIFRSIPLLFLARIFDGITGGNISVAQAAIADITAPENRAKNFGLIGAAFGMGFIVGPYLGGKLSDPSVVPWFSAVTPFLFASILSFINVLMVLFIFPETHPEKNKEKIIDWIKSVENVVKAYSLKSVRVLFATNFLYTAGFTFFTSFFSVFLINKFRYTQGNIGDFFAYVGIWIALGQAFVTRRAALKFSESTILKFCLLGSAFVVMCYFLPNVWWQLLLVAPFFSIFNGLVMANSTALISRSVDGKIQGEIMGINSSVQALAQSIPPILSGYIAANLSPESPIFVSSVVMAAAGFVFVFFYKKVKVS